MDTPDNVAVSFNYKPDAGMIEAIKVAVREIVCEEALNITTACVNSYENGAYSATLIPTSGDSIDIEFKLTAGTNALSSFSTESTGTDMNKVISDVADIDTYDVFIGSPLVNDCGDAHSDAAQNMIVAVLHSFTKHAPNLKVLAAFDQPVGNGDAYHKPDNGNITYVGSEKCVGDLYQRLLLSTKLRAFIHIGHGKGDGILLHGGETLQYGWVETPQLLSNVTSYQKSHKVKAWQSDPLSKIAPGLGGGNSESGFSTVTNTYYDREYGPVRSLDLSNMVITWNSCLVASGNMKSALLDKNARVFIGGETDLNVEEENDIDPLTGNCRVKGSGEVMASFWEAVLNTSPQVNMIEAFVKSYNEEYGQYSFGSFSGNEIYSVSSDTAQQGVDEISVSKNGGEYRYAGDDSPIGEFAYYGDEGALMPVGGWA